MQAAIALGGEDDERLRDPTSSLASVIGGYKAAAKHIKKLKPAAKAKSSAAGKAKA